MASYQHNWHQNRTLVRLLVAVNSREAEGDYLPGSTPISSLIELESMGLIKRGPISGKPPWMEWYRLTEIGKMGLADLRAKAALT